MSEPAFVPCSALAGITSGHHGAADEIGVTLTELSGLTLAALTAHNGNASALSAAIARDFGVALPMSPGRVADSAYAFVWSGRDRWLAVGTSGGDLARLTASAGAMGAVTDLSGSRSIVRISGLRARDGLMKLVPIDLDESVFAPGYAALTVAAHIPVQLWQVDATPTYDIACPRSYGVSLWQALVAAYVESGCEVRVS